MRLKGNSGRLYLSLPECGLGFAIDGNASCCLAVCDVSISQTLKRQCRVTADGLHSCWVSLARGRGGTVPENRCPSVDVPLFSYEGSSATLSTTGSTDVMYSAIYRARGASVASDRNSSGSDWSIVSLSVDVCFRFHLFIDPIFPM